MRSRVAVAASSTLAAQAGVRLADLGGNAVDAALAAVLVSMVCEPGVCAPGGGAYLTVAPADGSRPLTVDGNVEMPGRGLPGERFGRGSGLREVTTDYGGGLTMTVGHASVGTPGALAALELASRRWGRAPWREVVAPAVEAARDGFPLGAASAQYLGFVAESVFGWQPDSRAALHHADGRPVRAGERVLIASLADSLELIAAEGTSAFYRGELARLISADMEANGGILTAADLAAYRPVVAPALAADLGDWRLATNPPPAIGGVVLTAMLRLMDDRPRGVWTLPDVAHLVAVQDAVLRLRAEHLDLAPGADERIRAAEELLSAADPSNVGDLGGLVTSPSTVHISAVDAEGAACAITSSAGYGSGVMTPGTGIWHNNCLGEPELNRGGLHALAPGTRLPSNMAPTVGRRPDGAVLAIGSPGADRITTALLQVLASIAGAGMSLADAIARPRLHVRPPPSGPLLDYEEDCELPPLDGVPTRKHPRLSMFFGGVGAALREPDGALVAAGDPRRAAVVAVSGS